MAAEEELGPSRKTGLSAQHSVTPSIEDGAAVLIGKNNSPYSPVTGEMRIQNLPLPAIIIEKRMVPEVHYNAAQHVSPDYEADPYLRPAFPRRDRWKRAAWNACRLLLYRISPRPMHAWRSMLLRAFGAKMGPNCHFYPGSRVWAPWNLICADQVTAADGVEIYNPAPVNLGSHVVLSQGAYLCAATHDYNEPSFPLSRLFDEDWSVRLDLCTRICGAQGQRRRRCCAWARFRRIARFGAVGSLRGIAGREGKRKKARC